MRKGEGRRGGGEVGGGAGGGGHYHHHHHHHHRVYKRRWFGLVQLVLLNVVVSWDWLTFSAVSTTASQFFNVSENAINWLSIGFLFAFVVITPVVILVLHRGPKPSIIAASVFALVGNWIRYAGARAGNGNFGVVVFGQIVIGLAQPFVLAAPTRYSDLWFSDHGRVSATAVASLANPLGGALGQVIGPLWTDEDPANIPNLVLYMAIISTVIAVPSFFIPAAPPTPPSASSALPKPDLKTTFHALLRNRSFPLVFIPFSVYVGFFNAFSSLINQILAPYSFSEDDAGICGALLIFVGLGAAAVTSPLLDRNHAYLVAIKALVPLVGASYLAFYWAPPTRDLAAPFVVAAVLGAASFALVPVSLEFLVGLAWPASPEVSSTVCWAGGQLLGGVFLVVMGEMKAGGGRGDGWGPPENMQRALVFEAVIACVVVPLPLLLGVRRLGFGDVGRERLRLDEEERAREREEDAEEERRGRADGGI
ncbi:major facilitator superfamily domain-containing protein [Lineolata rhizophorae]|uniref:Major facilitator superfamily domain-containing protein n=1 Tax=Lineolata rhizophorae TaxID=578093 RepID=A0A6A6P952_9PEZI|nr:major facilitator superfamily domain-containing protein [Lineolata rhizophorae]